MYNNITLSRCSHRRFSGEASFPRKNELKTETQETAAPDVDRYTLQLNFVVRAYLFVERSVFMQKYRKRDKMCPNQINCKRGNEMGKLSSLPLAVWLCRSLRPSHHHTTRNSCSVFTIPHHGIDQQHHTCTVIFIPCVG